MAVVTAQLVVTMGGSHTAAAAARVGRALLPIKTGARGVGGGRVDLHHLFLCRYPLIRGRCFGTTENPSHAREMLSELLDRNWMLSDPGAKINQISVVAHGQQGTDLSSLSFANNLSPSLVHGYKGQTGGRPYFYVVRDDLLHPLLNGNKARKLDAVMPILQEHSITDVVTCGGCQSAHAAAVGVIRLVKYLSQAHLFGKEQKITIVLDAGTGTTAVGLAIGTVCLGLPWKIVAVMLADSTEGYTRRERCMISNFKRIFKSEYVGLALNGFDGGIIHWVDRIHPRRFGNVRRGEVEMCRDIAKRTGILVDPVYTLAAWEQAVRLCQAEAGCGENVVMLHTGGTLGMFGLAQRYKSYFHEA